MPIQNGELVQSARMCGRKYRMEFMMWMAVLRSSMPMCTCNPKTRLARAINCMSSTTRRNARRDKSPAASSRKTGGYCRRQQHAVLAGQGNHLAAQRLDIFPRLLDVLQTRVPTSMTDWCISGLTASCSASLALDRIRKRYASGDRGSRDRWSDIPLRFRCSG